ncbi:hypothetical protein BDF21DRAFT_396843 [Thamnidium elegans]|nr:hypothetical protein BDF21DRAFT_396843 [Thamnidium elegans]
MSKGGWGNLPKEILCMVFNYLENQVMVSASPMKYMGFPCAKSISQCQLTCKNWSTLAQSKLYKCVFFKSPIQLDLMIRLCSHIKGLVYHIRLTKGYDSFFPSLIKIALHFTELKSLYHDYNLGERIDKYHHSNLNERNKPFYHYSEPTKGDIWQVVKSEWSKGRFSKLQVIPFTCSATVDDIVEYNDITWCLRKNLRELKVYDMAWDFQRELHEFDVYDFNPVSTQNTERLSHFTSLDAVYFHLCAFNNVYTIDQQLKKAGSLRSVNVTSNESYYKSLQINPHIHVLSQVRQLDISGFKFDCDIYPYVMQVFPKLDRISLATRDFEDNGIMLALSTEVTIQFLEYLLRIPFFYVKYMPMENLEQALMGFCYQKRMVKRLDITYFQNNRAIHSPSYLSMWNNVNDEICMEVSYAREIPTAMFPRIGMIEHNGDDLRCIRMSMGFKFSDIELLVNQEDRDNLSRILCQCPNLQSIFIVRTMLRTFGSSLQEKKISFFQKIELKDSLVYSSFLSDMSFHLPVIHWFHMSGCLFAGEAENNATINMPHTKFTNISFSKYNRIHTWYLKLTTIENNSTRWFVNEKRHHNTCSENEYQNSLEDKKTISVFIRCSNKFTIGNNCFELFSYRDFLMFTFFSFL